MKDLSHIYKIDIELQSFCNRKCDWCPNKEFDRTFKEEMSDKTFECLLIMLKESNYGIFKNNHIPIFSFLGYQECFSNVEYFSKRLNEIKKVFNNAIYVTNSNGDYLNKDNLQKVKLNSLSIQDYDNKGFIYWYKKFQEFEVFNINYNIENGVLFGNHYTIENINVVLNWANKIKLENRGGYFKHNDLPNMNWLNNMDIRTQSCPEAEYFLTISYDGSVMPCCHMRPDNPEHKDYILGNIQDTSLLDIYYSEKAEQFREKMRIDNGEYPEPCKYCQKTREGNLIGSPYGYWYINNKYIKV